MKNEIKKAGWELDSIWGKVASEKATRSWGREQSKVSIMKMIVNCQHFRDIQKKKILKECGFVTQSEYARLSKKSKQWISKNLMRGGYYPSVDYNGRTYIYHPKALDL